ncbi:DUF4139 domain-containing protein [Mucilaginibacter psychrotolerans]|uniref:Mucoidy inhibitor MuiA family protein n=1 Tax=Mucilaginibacter psychrotolerans TaxID=1524096 RepID=A0A4Y8S470_9SPHI|nr:DUF4139 domain-containing protein [Mucilaginibacter psychrotolerans]TFF33733.1 mucoidy inhibitor MuiA family protein [Mucilaginibacter psychrotolerans]
MKKLLLVTCLLISIQTLRADDGQKVPTKVEKVTVFLSGAQVTRTAIASVVPGTSTLSFENLSPELDPASIQVRATGDFTILSVKHELNYLGEQLKTKKLEELQAMQQTLRDKISLQTALLNINQEEANMLTKNQVSNGQTAGLDIIKLRAALDFQTARLTEIKKKELAINAEIAQLNVQLRKYDSQVNQLINTRGIASSNILVNVSSGAALQSTFTITYVVGQASWQPTYDIRAKNVSSPVVIAYKANVSQQCGEDWKDVKLTLSTGDPSVSGQKPDLRPYYLNIQPPVQYDTNDDKSLNEVVVTGALGVKRVAKPMYYSTSVAVNTTENQTSMEFNIQNPFSIPNDGKQYAVEIDQVTTNATYQYYAAPKLSTDVFLTARITDWTKYNFLSGEANLFFEGTFIGKSRLDTRAANDTLSLSLGVDKNIVVKRLMQTQLADKQGIFGSSKKETRDWSISIKNRKTQAINLLIEDQVPVSQNAAIEVDTQDISGAEMDKATGKLSWTFTLEPQAVKQLRVKYTVKYPKNQSVLVQ